ncbi:NAD(P)H-dependent oxidoreductase [Brachybacterium halotolerans subsp. kimchii]|uniref:CE1759 family FMN reductase n=1 Tax=Brachybacterium halotolerans TaxID=2795215 RepID=UPI001E360285|nr:CE1759 family FMN reductase [Brachybacterium halotolerans]UEJ84396.1 NAD(P)H-dependent oxidoreductase [Brachybacterium halotolerans subsp. kimchii]
MPRTYRVLTLTAGLSTPSSTRMLADQLTAAARTALEATGAEVEASTIELREHAHDLTDALLSHFPGERLRPVVDAIREADAVIAVTPIFNVGPSGLFKLLIDALDKDLWRGKPVLLGATAGTARHSLALDFAIRPMFSYLRAELVPTAVFAASADFGGASAAEASQDPLVERAHRAGGELAAMLSAGVGRADGSGQTDDGSEGADRDDDADDASVGTSPALDAEFSDFVPMGRLLGH